MRKPLAVFGLAAATLLAGGLTAQALAHEPPGTSDQRQSAGQPDLPAHRGSPEPMLPSAVDGWGGVPPLILPSAGTGAPSLSAAASPPAPTASGASDGDSARDDAVSGGPAAGRPTAEKPPRDELGSRAMRHGILEAGPVDDVIEAARKEVTPASAAPGLQAPVQQQVLALANQQRRKAGCAPVTLDRRLVEAANRHAADMARRGYFDHESPGGDRAGSRVSEAGYTWSRYGENIAKGQESPYEVMADWMQSPSHRENILDCRLDQMGVGLALDSGDTPYWVQDFATPR
jgi:uncharacterized protein YkwD